MSAVAAHAAPVWDLYPALVCRGDAFLDCNADLDCKRTNSFATITVDFRANTVKDLPGKTANNSVNIVARRFFPGLANYSPDDSTVFTDGAQTIVFGQPDKGAPGQSDRVRGLVLYAANNQPLVAKLLCAPP